MIRYHEEFGVWSFDSLEDVKAFRQVSVHVAAGALGRCGGKKGGLARAASLTPEQRTEIAKKAANARWNRPGRRRN
jgi:hypothetical protein